MPKTTLKSLLEKVATAEVYDNGDLFSLACTESGNDFAFFSPTINYRTKTFTALVVVDPRLDGQSLIPPYFRVANLVLMDDYPELRSDENLAALIQAIDLRLQNHQQGMFRIHGLVHSSNGVHLANSKFMDFSKTAFVIRKNEFLQFFSTNDRNNLPKDLPWVFELNYRGQTFQICSRVIRDMQLDAEVDHDLITAMLAPFLPNIY